MSQQRSRLHVAQNTPKLLTAKIGLSNAVRNASLRLITSCSNHYQVICLYKCAWGQKGLVKPVIFGGLRFAIGGNASKRLVEAISASLIAYVRVYVRR